MIIKSDGKDYSFPDYILSNLDIRDLSNKINTKIPQDIFNPLLNDLDCTKDYGYGRIMMTTYPMYARNITAYIYVLDELLYTEKIIDIEEYDSWVRKLIERHLKNIDFENNNPYTPPVSKSKRQKRKVVTYKTKDLITGEDTFLVQDIKSKKYKVNKNPHILDKVKPYKGRSLSEMYFDFNSKDD